VPPDVSQQRMHHWAAGTMSVAAFYRSGSSIDSRSIRIDSAWDRDHRQGSGQDSRRRAPIAGVDDGGLAGRRDGGLGELDDRALVRSVAVDANLGGDRRPTVAKLDARRQLGARRR
jgi:hypothetical protein